MSPAFAIPAVVVGAQDFNFWGPPGGAPIWHDDDIIANKRKRDQDVVVVSDDDEDDMDDVECVVVGRPPVGVNFDGVFMPVYEVERIITMRDTRRGRQYFVQWAGYSKAEASWKYEEELDGAQAAIYEYLQTRNHRRQRRN